MFAKFVLKNGVFLNLVALFIVLVGIKEAVELKREAFPNVDFDVVTVQTFYPGASAIEVENYVTDPLEEALKTVDEIKDLSSTSIEGFSAVSLQIDPDADDKDEVVQNIKDAVESVNDLPDEVLDDPIVREIATRNTPIVQVALSGLNEVDLRLAAQELEKRFLDIDDIGAVARKGYRDIEIAVDVDPDKLQRYVMSLAQVSGKIGSSNKNLPAGSIKTKEREYLVRTVGESKQADEIGKIVLQSNDIGELIMVKDVAKVTEQFEEAKRLFRTDGQPSINLVVIKKESGDAIDLVLDAKKVANEFLESGKYPGLRVGYLNDFSYYVKRRLNVLMSNAYVGILLVLACLILFLSPGISVMTAIGMPVAFAGAVAGMSYLGTSINLISMFGLIIVLGIVVDDAIIVAENIFHHAKNGEEPDVAVEKGLSEVVTPVTATILTTVAAFSPLMMMTGIMGKFMYDMPLAVVIALAVSWFESLVILPSHVGDMLKLSNWIAAKRGEPTEPGIVKKILSAPFAPFLFVWRRGGGWIVAVYKGLLAGVLKLRYLSFAVALGFFAFSMNWAKTEMNFILFPSDGVEQFFARVQMPTGTDLETTSQELQRIEKMLAALPVTELNNYTTDVGINQNDPNDPFTARGSHLGQIQVFLTPEGTESMFPPDSFLGKVQKMLAPAKTETSRVRTADDIILELEEKIAAEEFAAETIKVEKVRNGPPQGKPVAIKIAGESYEQMLEVADDLVARLEEMEHVRGPSHDYEEGKRELVVKVNRAKAAIKGVDPETVAFQVRGAYEGLIASTVRRGDEEIDVRVRFEDKRRNRLRSFDDIYIPNQFNRLVSLRSIASIEDQAGIGTIFHDEGDRIITVSADIDEKETSSLKVGAAVGEWVPDLENKYKGIRILLAGGYEDTQESMQSLGQSFLIALFLIFMILAALFRSIFIPGVVLTAIPFALTGVIWSFYFHNMPLSFLGMLGAIGLAGVAVNDAIVLVSFVNTLRLQGTPLIDAAVEGSSRRILPVWLTTITTVVGLMPVAYGLGGFDPFLRPPAIAIGWGLCVATFVTLFIVPTFYVLLFTVIWDTQLIWRTIGNIILLPLWLFGFRGIKKFDRPPLRASDVAQDQAIVADT